MIKNTPPSYLLNIILKQLHYWHKKSGDGFFKFLEPCNHVWYKSGDSWCEELKLSGNTTRKYLKIICTPYHSHKILLKQDNVFKNKPYLSYFDRTLKITRFFKNPNFIKSYTSYQNKEKSIKKTDHYLFFQNYVSNCVPLYSNKTNNKLLGFFFNIIKKIHATSLKKVKKNISNLNLSVINTNKLYKSLILNPNNLFKIWSYLISND